MVPLEAADEAVFTGFALKLEGGMVYIEPIPENAVDVTQDIGTLACQDVFDKDMPA